MRQTSARHQTQQASRDGGAVNLIGQAFLHAFGGGFQGINEPERPEPCRQEDYDWLEQNRRGSRFASVSQEVGHDISRRIS
jgi:hypothetical protein